MEESLSLIVVLTVLGLQDVRVEKLEQASGLWMEQRNLQFLIDIIVRWLEPQLFDAWHLEKLNDGVLELLNDEDRDPRDVDLPRYPLAYPVIILLLFDLCVHQLP